jgi:hypothetical protein
MKESAPSLRRQCEQLIPICEQLKREQPSVSIPVWLASVAESLGNSFLELKPIDRSQHTVMDPETELALDYGSGITDKIIRPDDEDGF